ncbi:MAG TPA: glycerophosphodiester phosphodiesterase [Gaiellaceae bacterium]|nr:glycerophosphodiester phosphodiesterase [Gaiellaceae bacterium]
MLVIAHRGASGDLPENTLPAFERAIDVGADYVELDVHADREGRLVVTHDAPRRGERYPSLDETLDLCHGRIGVMVELKRPGRYRGIVPRVLASMHDDDVLVCFQRAALEEARALRPALRTMQHVGFGVSIRRASPAWAAGFQNERVTRRGLAAARALGLETAVYTVNDEERIDVLEQLGVTGVFTDYPDRALAALGRRPRG